MHNSCLSNFWMERMSFFSMQRYGTFKTVIILQHPRLRSGEAVVVKTETELLTCFTIAQVLYKFYKIHELISGGDGTSPHSYL